MVVLGDRNSRIKDFFDLRHLAERFAFERETLAEAIQRTFRGRHTPIPEEPVGLTAAYWNNPSRPQQVRAFARRAHVEAGLDPGEDLLRVLRPFLLPILDDLRRGVCTRASWPPRGPWR